jgi:enediyne biosynthesis protein E4
VVVNNLGQKASVLRNDGGNRRNWIGIQTVGTKSNRDGIGSRVKVVSASGVAQYFTVNTAVGYLSASDKRLVVGLGSNSSAKVVEIRWPSGTTQKFENVKAGQILHAVEPHQ